MTDNYRKPSEFQYKMAVFGAPDEATICCAIRQFCVRRGLAIDEKHNQITAEELLIDARVRHPEELAGQFIQLKLTKTRGNLIDLRDPDGPAIGELTFISGGDEFVEEDSLHVRQSIPPDLFESFVSMVFEGQRLSNLTQEVEVTVIGLLNEWDRSGYLRVTKVNLISARVKVESET